MRIYPSNGSGRLKVSSPRRARPTIAGYELIRQVEAVYVDGFRHPEEALQGLKAAAALKGANALTHVGHTRSASGRCAASGDAVVVRLLETGHDEPSVSE